MCVYIIIVNSFTPLSHIQQANTLAVILPDTGLNRSSLELAVHDEFPHPMYICMHTQYCIVYYPTWWVVHIVYGICLHTWRRALVLLQVVCKHVRVYVCACSCVYTRAYIYIHTDTFTNALKLSAIGLEFFYLLYEYECLQMYAIACQYVCMCLSMYVCYVCMYVMCVCILWVCSCMLYDHASDIYLYTLFVTQYAMTSKVTDLGLLFLEIFWHYMHKPSTILDEKAFLFFGFSWCMS